MKKTKIKFEDIKAGDLLEVVGKGSGVKSVLTGVAFESDTTGDEETIWMTSEGGAIAMQWDRDDIFRIDVAEAKFEDIRKGDRVRATTVQDGRTVTVEAVADQLVGPDFNRFWVDEFSLPIVYATFYSDVKLTIEILERAE